MAGTLTRADAALSRCGEGHIDLILMDICTESDSDGLTAAESVKLGFYDACLPGPGFTVDVARRAAELAAAPDIGHQLAAKAAKRAADEAQKPLAAYRAEELAEMRRNFYGFDPSYHVARYHFVSRSPHSWTPRHLARHRDLDWKVSA